MLTKYKRRPQIIQNIRLKRPLVQFYYQAIIVILGILYFVQVYINNSQILQHFANKYKLGKEVILKLSLKVTLCTSSNLTKEVEYFSFFREEIVIINAELFLYLNPLIFKNRVNFIKQQLGVRELNKTLITLLLYPRSLVYYIQ